MSRPLSPGHDRPVGRRRPSVAFAFVAALAACGAEAGPAGFGPTEGGARSARALEIAGVSGASRRGHLPAHAIDGAPDTRWAPARLGDALEIELAHPAFVDTLEVTWHDAPSPRHWREVHAETSAGVREVANGRSSPGGPDRIDIQTDEPVSRLRLHPVLPEDGGFPAVDEVRVLGRPASEEGFQTGPSARPSPSTRSVLGVADVIVDDYTSIHGGSRAVDGRADSRWERRGAGGWIVLVLETAAPVDAVEIDWHEGEARTYEVSIAGSTDGVRYDDLLSTRSRREAGPEVHRLPGTPKLSSILLEITSGTAAIDEIRVLGPASPTEPAAPPEPGAPSPASAPAPSAASAASPGPASAPAAPPEPGAPSPASAPAPSAAPAASPGPASAPAAPPEPGAPAPSAAPAPTRATAAAAPRARVAATPPAPSAPVETAPEAPWAHAALTPPFASEGSSPGQILRVLHVSPDGEDAADGSRARPWRTLSHAVAQLRPGDELRVHGGTWSETIELSRSGTAEHPIRLVALEGAMLDYRDERDLRDVAVRISGSHVEVRGFSIHGRITGFELGDGLYPLNDVCADEAAFHRGADPARRDDFYCEGHTSAANHRVENVIIDGRRPDGTRAVLDLPAGAKGWHNGVNVFDEAQDVVIRNYEMTRMRHGVFADGAEQVRSVVNLTLEGLYVHHTRNYGARIVARESHIATPAREGGSGPRFWRYREGQRPDQVYLTENLARRQTVRNLVIRSSVFHANAFTDAATGEAYGNVLLQGVQGGLVERSVFSDGAYWGIDALMCDDVLYRNNVFSMRPEVRARPRRWPDAHDPWPVVGLEVNGGEGNRVYNNVFYGFESGVFESWFPEDFVATAVSVESRNNIFWNNDASFARWPTSAWLESDALRPTWRTTYVPVDGLTVERRERDNLMDTGTNVEIVNGQRQQRLGGDPEFFGTNNIVDPSAHVGFVDPANGDFRLRAGSAAVDRGADLFEVAEDFDGRARPPGSSDLGPFER